MQSGILTLTLRLLPFLLVRGDEDTHTYEDKERILLWTDKVGSYNNPQETYGFYSLELCEQDRNDKEFWEKEVKHREVTIGESFEGHEFDSSPLINIEFGVESDVHEICSMTLDEKKASTLEHKIRENYWYSVYIDDLPVWIFLGEHDHGFGHLKDIHRHIASDEENGDQTLHEVISDKLKDTGEYVSKIFTHRTFVIQKNGNRVISVDVETSKQVKVNKDTELKFTYSVKWAETTIPFESRFDKYLDTRFFEHKVHWFSIVNSFMLCIFLIAVVSIILAKTLRNDFSRYAVTNENDLDGLDQGADETGWKQISGDVFRKPDHLLPFSVLYAAGSHMVALVALSLLLCILNSYYVRRGSTGQALIFCYFITQCVSGFQGGYLYRLHQGKHWKKAMACQCLFVPTVLFSSFCCINTVALYYKSTMSLPFKTIALVLLLFCILCVPLHTIGTLLGRRSAAEASFPTRVHHLKRPIPQKKMGFHPGMIAISGLIPFGCVFIEMYFLFSAFWSYNKVYYVYGFLLMIVTLLSLVLICISITCTYILLNSEDYRWTWHSFLGCASTSIYVFIYAIYYYFTSTHMSGTLQFVYYFSSTFNFCVAFGLFCGALGYYGASVFVYLIYSNVKAD